MTDTDRKLPVALAEALPPDQRRALDNPVRRSILRVLHAAAEPAGLRDLTPAVAGAGLSSVSYHLAVLEQRGCVTSSVDPAGPPCCARRFASSLLGDPRVAEALEATRELDGAPS